jgi:hypothetical protein
MDEIVSMVKDLNIGDKEEDINIEENMGKFYEKEETKFGTSKGEKVDKRIKSKVKNEREKLAQRKNTGDEDFM